MVDVVVDVDVVLLIVVVVLVVVVVFVVVVVVAVDVDVVFGVAVNVEIRCLCWLRLSTREECGRGARFGVAIGGTHPRRSKNAQINRKAIFFTRHGNPLRSVHHTKDHLDSASSFLAPTSRRVRSHYVPCSSRQIRTEVVSNSWPVVSFPLCVLL